MGWGGAGSLMHDLHMHPYTICRGGMENDERAALPRYTCTQCSGSLEAMATGAQTYAHVHTPFEL